LLKLNIRSNNIYFNNFFLNNYCYKDYNYKNNYFNILNVFVFNKVFFKKRYRFFKQNKRILRFIQKFNFLNIFNNKNDIFFTKKFKIKFDLLDKYFIKTEKMYKLIVKRFFFNQEINYFFIKNKFKN
jgi:hypothetical protein